MGRIIKFGENAEGFSIPVLNEREIRAAAGILFLIMFTSILAVVFKDDFSMLKYAITIFLTDISIRVFIYPKYSPFLIIGRMIVSNQVPEYVGARQKKAAWIIGTVLAAIMFILLVVLNTRSPITGIICLICLTFLFFEAAFGICLGCKFYSMIYKEKAQHCPGEVCDINSKHEIQKTSVSQVLVAFGLLIYIFLLVIAFNHSFSKQPNELFRAESYTQSE